MTKNNALVFLKWLFSCLDSYTVFLIILFMQYLHLILILSNFSIFEIWDSCGYLYTLSMGIFAAVFKTMPYLVGYDHPR